MTELNQSTVITIYEDLCITKMSLDDSITIMGDVYDEYIWVEAESSEISITAKMPNVKNYPRPGQYISVKISYRDPEAE